MEANSGEEISGGIVQERFNRKCPKKTSGKDV